MFEPSTKQEYIKPQDIQKKIGSIEAGFKKVRLDEGKLGWFDTVEEEAYNRVVTDMPDYKDNQSAYDSFADLGSFVPLNRQRYEAAVEDDIFTLDDNGKLIEGSNHFTGAGFLFDTDTMRGYLLAKKNGFTEDTYKTKYKEIVKEEDNKIANAEENLAGEMLGGLGGYVSPELLTDFASPGKIVGKGIIKTAAKAFGIEAAYIASGETLREQARIEHKEALDEDRTLWDSIQEILINSGFGGLIRGIGSGVVDYKTIQNIKSKVKGEDEKAIIDKFFGMQEAKLTKNIQAHRALLAKAEADIENGRVPDIAQHTEIDPITKADDGQEPINMTEEFKKDTNVQKDVTDYDKLEDELMEVQNNPEFKDEEALIDETLATYADRLDDEESLLLKKELEELEAENVKYNLDEVEGLLKHGGKDRTLISDVLDIEKPTNTKGVRNAIDRFNKGEATDRDYEILDSIDRYMKYEGAELLQQNKVDYTSDIIPDDIPEGYKIVDDTLVEISSGKALFSLNETLGGAFAGGSETMFSERDWNNDGKVDEKDIAIGAFIGATGINIVKKYKPELFDSGLKEGDQVAGSFLDKAKAKNQAKIDSGEIPELGRIVKLKGESKDFFYGESGKVYWRGKRGWRETQNFERIKDVKQIVDDPQGYKERKELEAKENKEFEEQITYEETKDTYHDQHTAPTRDEDGTTSIDNLTEIYPSDIYSKDAARLYGHNEKSKDDIAMDILRKIKGNPDAEVTIYRAIPKDINAEINPGDWVTITKQYAIEHGNARFDGEYKMLEKKVKAKEIITDGNSIHEQGYDPIKGSN